MALALSCVINNLCMAVQQLESVSVFIKMLWTIFTARPRCLRCHYFSMHCVCYICFISCCWGNFFLLSPVVFWPSQLVVQQVSASCQATVCLPSITCKLSRPPKPACVKVTQCSNCIYGPFSSGKRVKKVSLPCYCQSATDVHYHFSMHEQNWWWTTSVLMDCRRVFHLMFP